MEKKVIIVGASSGIGAELAKQLLRDGNKVVLIARRDKELKKIADAYNLDSKNKKAYVIKHDVTETEKANELFDKAIKDLGGLDEIYFASGILHSVRPDEFNTKKDIEMMNVNILGAIAWINPAAEYFQKTGKGKIIGISSIAGDRGRTGNPIYNTSKAAMNTYLEAVRNRLARKGIQVLTVKPGFIDTPMTKGLKGMFWLITAEEAARLILKATDSGKETIYVPWKWNLVAIIIKLIPSFIFKKLNV